MKRLLSLTLAIASAASCEVRSDLVLPEEGTPSAGGRASVIIEGGPPDAPAPHPEAGGTSVADAGPEGAPPPDAPHTDAAIRDAAPPDATRPDAARPDAAPEGECSRDDDCPFYDPRCDPQTLRCVDCLDNDDCDGDDDICDPVLLRCVECVFDADCRDRDQPLCRDSECTER